MLRRIELTNFFREDLSEIVGAYFDGEKIFVAHLSEKVETFEIDADSSEIERLAEKISLVCNRNGWRTSAVGFCLREGDAVTFQTEVENIPERDYPALVKSWAVAQGNKDAISAFTKVGTELWMETLPQTTIDEFCAAWKKFGMNLRGLSMMPVDLLTKITPIDRAKFIAEVVRDKKAPNLLAARNSILNWKKISAAIAAIFFIALLVTTIKIFLDDNEAHAQLDAAKISVNERRDDLALKESLDADIAELNRLNQIGASQNITPTKFNLLINLGKVAGGGVSLTKIRADENFLELEGIAVTSDAVKSYLSRVKNSVVQSARLESSKARDDGDIIFTIRATLKQSQ